MEGGGFSDGGGYGGAGGRPERSLGAVVRRVAGSVRTERLEMKPATVGSGSTEQRRREAKV